MQPSEFDPGSLVIAPLWRCEAIGVTEQLEPSDEDIALAQELLAQWDEGRGVSKSQLEIKTWDDATSHGRHFDRFIGKTLGITTSRRSRQSDRISDLERQVRSLGRHPVGTEPAEWEVQLQHGRESCLQALRVWNDPTSTFRTATFSMLFVTAWNSVAIALLMRDGEEWRELDEIGDPILVDAGVAKSRDTRDLMRDAFAGDERLGLRQNVTFWIDLRNAVAHRCLPALDAMVIPYAQAGLINFDGVLRDCFGSEYTLGEALSVPLQLSGFREPNVLESRKRLFASLPIDVQGVLSNAASVDELLDDPTYMLRVAFVPVVPASGRSPDAVAYFVRPGEVPEELAEMLERYVVLAKPRRSAATLRAGDVVREVARRTGFKFHWNQHSPAARALGVWPPEGESPRTMDERYAEYNTAFKGWLYTPAWVDLLVERLSTPEQFRAVTGRDPVPIENA